MEFNIGDVPTRYYVDFIWVIPIKYQISQKWFITHKVDIWLVGGLDIYVFFCIASQHFFYGTSSVNETSHFRRQFVYISSSLLHNINI